MRKDFDLEHPLIEIKGLRKVIGTKEVLENVSLIFPKGSSTVNLEKSGNKTAVTGISFSSLTLSPEKRDK